MYDGVFRMEGVEDETECAKNFLETIKFHRVNASMSTQQIVCAIRAALMADYTRLLLHLGVKSKKAFEIFMRLRSMLTETSLTVLISCKDEIFREIDQNSRIHTIILHDTSRRMAARLMFYDVQFTHKTTDPNDEETYGMTTFEVFVDKFQALELIRHDEKLIRMLAKVLNFFHFLPHSLPSLPVNEMCRFLKYIELRLCCVFAVFTPLCQRHQDFANNWRRWIKK